MEYKCLSDFLFKGENKNINIRVSKISPVINPIFHMDWHVLVQLE